MEGFLKIVFILILVYYAFKLTATYVFPWLLGRFVKKQQEKFFGQNQSNESKTKYDVKNATNSKTKKSTSKDDSSFGEYVDYEEVKE